MKSERARNGRSNAGARTRTVAAPLCFAATLVLGACNAEIPSGRFVCEDDGECPPTMSCQLTERGKRCVRGARADADAAAEPRDASTADGSADASASDGAAGDASGSPSARDGGPDAAAAIDPPRDGGPGVDAGAIDAAMLGEDARTPVEAGERDATPQLDAAPDASVDAGPEAAAPFPTPCIRWIPHRAGPNDAVAFQDAGAGWAAGSDILPQYHCRAKVRDQVYAVPGKAIPKQGCYVVSFSNGIESVLFTEYELGVPERGCQLAWRDLCEGSLPPGATAFGVDEQRRPFYSCNIQVEHDQHEYAGSHIGVMGGYTSNVCIVAFPPFGTRSNPTFAVLAAVPELEARNPDYCRQDGGARSTPE